MPAVIFNPEEFREINPRFADIPDAQLEFAFALACELTGNSEGSVVPYDPPEVATREILLYALVCHFCELWERGGGITGALIGATQGSVSASFAPLAAGGADAAWYMQTECGATAWLLLKRHALGGRLYQGR